MGPMCDPRSPAPLRARGTPRQRQGGASKRPSESVAGHGPISPAHHPPLPAQTASPKQSRKRGADLAIDERPSARWRVKGSRLSRSPNGGQGVQVGQGEADQGDARPTGDASVAILNSSGEVLIGSSGAAPTRPGHCLPRASAHGRAALLCHRWPLSQTRCCQPQGGYATADHRSDGEGRRARHRIVYPRNQAVNLHRSIEQGGHDVGGRDRGACRALW